MKDFDTTHDSRVDLSEFIAGVERWLAEARGAEDSNHADSMKYIDEFHMVCCFTMSFSRVLFYHFNLSCNGIFLQQTKRDHDLLGEQSEEIDDGVESARWTSLKAGLMLLLGTVIAAAFADPLVDAVDNFSSATNIPTFFISFVGLPLATNSSEAVSAIIFASRKKLKSASLTFSEVSFLLIVFIIFLVHKPSSYSISGLYIVVYE